jgi:LCP family protein required for cell wall assembly
MRRPELIEPALRVRRAATLLAITLLVPGSAQLVAGDRRLGRIAVKIWLGVLGLLTALAALALLDRPALIGLFTKPLVLGLIATACFALAVVWPILILDAWRLGRMPLLPMKARRWFALATVALVLLTALPLVAVGRRAWAAEDFLGSVFSSTDKANAAEGRFNVLLLGADSGKTRVGTRPDSITLASIDADTGRTALFSLPRNLENVRFPGGSAAARLLPDGWSCGDDCLVNGLYTWGTEHPEAFPGAKDPGAEAMKQAVGQTLGLPVQYYVMIDLNGFRALVDALGGIDLNVKERVPIGGGTSKIWGYIEPGKRHLNGFRALWYGRSREGASDYARMARQRCVMQAMLEQLDPPTVLRRFQAIAKAGKNVMSTDIPASHLATFIELAQQARGQKVTSVQFVPPLIKPAYADYGLIRTTVAETIAAVEKAASGEPARAAQQKSAEPGTAKQAASSKQSDPGKQSDSSKNPGAAKQPQATPPAVSDSVSAVCSAA